MSSAHSAAVPQEGRGGGEGVDGQAGCPQAFRNEAGHALETWGTCFIAHPQQLCCALRTRGTEEAGQTSPRTIVFLLPPELLLGRTWDSCTLLPASGKCSFQSP